MNMRSPGWFGLILAAVIAGCSSPDIVRKDQVTISTAETYRILGQDTAYVFLDVRTPAEYGSITGHLEGALLIPVDTLERQMASLETFRSKTIIAYCRSGVRSLRAQKILAGHGFRALSMAGGITRWNSENLPVVKEPQ